jgi:hypothetical protein
MGKCLLHIGARTHLRLLIPKSERPTSEIAKMSSYVSNCLDAMGFLQIRIGDRLRVGVFCLAPHAW